MPTLFFDGGSYLGVPCRGALLDHVEQEGGKKVQINKARENLEGGNQVSPKSLPPQGMKAQPPQWEVTTCHLTIL